MLGNGNGNTKKGNGGGGNELQSAIIISGTSEPDWVVIGADETSSLGYEEIGAIVGPHDNYEINLGGGDDELWIDLSAYDVSEDDVTVVEGNGNKGDTLTYTIDGNSYELTLKNVESVVILTSGDVGDPPPVSGGTLTFDEAFVANDSLAAGEYTEANYTAYIGPYPVDTADGYQFKLASGATYVVLQTTDAAGGPLENVGSLVDSGADGDADLEFRIYTDNSGNTHEFNLMLASDDFVFGPGGTFTVDSFTLEGLNDGEIIEIYHEDAGGVATSTYYEVDTDASTSTGYAVITTTEGGSHTFGDDLADISYFNVNLNGSGNNAEIYIDDIALL